MKSPSGPPLPNGHRKWLGRLGREVSVQASARGVSAVEMLRPSAGDGNSKNGAGREASSLGLLARQARKEIEEYLAGRRRRFGVGADLSALAPFSRAVLRETARIPYGETRTYGWIAQKIGRPGAARAVGQALGRNPVPLLIPCHRVVASAGLGGFAREKRLTGLKAALLALERGHARKRAAP